MTEIERKALTLLNEVLAKYPLVSSDVASNLAICRAIEAHEAFRQEVSDAVREWFDGHVPGHFQPFIIAKPVDPLVEALQAVDEFASPTWVERIAPQLRAALAARGLEIRSKTDG